MWRLNGRRPNNRRPNGQRPKVMYPKNFIRPYFSHLHQNSYYLLEKLFRWRFFSHSVSRYILHYHKWFDFSQTLALTLNRVTIFSIYSCTLYDIIIYCDPLRFPLRLPPCDPPRPKILGRRDSPTPRIDAFPKIWFPPICRPMTSLYAYAYSSCP